LAETKIALRYKSNMKDMPGSVQRWMRNIADSLISSEFKSTYAS